MASLSPNPPIWYGGPHWHFTKRGAQQSKGGKHSEACGRKKSKKRNQMMKALSEQWIARNPGKTYVYLKALDKEKQERIIALNPNKKIAFVTV